MNFQYLKIGIRRQLLIWTSVGMLLLVAGCASETGEEWEPEAVIVPAEEMVTIPWNHGWTPAISAVRGIPIELRGSDEVTYDISGDTSYLCIEEAGALQSMSRAGTTLKAEEQFYWTPLCEDARVNLEDIQASWIRIVQKQEEHPTGLVLVKITSESVQTEDGFAGPLFKADIAASLSFPRQDGDYQPISDEDLKVVEDTYKE